MADTMVLDPGQKAAAVVVALGAENASKIYKYLTEEEVEKLTVEIAKLGRLEADEAEGILDEFYKNCLTQKVVADGGVEYARSVLEKAYGETTANELLKKVTKFLKNRPFEFLRKADTKGLFSILQHERPQMIALILSYTDVNLAAELIAELPDDKRITVVENIAKMEGASPEAIKIVESQMRKRFDSILTNDVTTVGGVDYIADIMNQMDRGTEKSIFEEMEKNDPELTEVIRKKMFVFEDISTMDPRSIQRFIRDCDMKDIVYALKTADEELMNLFYSNMSTRMADSVKADLEITTNVRLKDVEEAQQKIVSLIRKLEEQGELIISKGGKDDIVV